VLQFITSPLVRATAFLFLTLDIIVAPIAAYHHLIHRGNIPFVVEVTLLALAANVLTEYAVMYGYRKRAKASGRPALPYSIMVKTALGEYFSATVEFLSYGAF
jgi:hypothetical protein